MIVPLRIAIAAFVVLVHAHGTAQAAQAAQTPSGQPSAPAPVPPNTQTPASEPINSTQSRLEQISRNHLRLTGQVELQLPGSPSKFFADEVDLFTDTSRLTASGNVVFTGEDGRIAADRVEFDWKAGTGTFHLATGIMTVGGTVDRAAFGNQDPDVYFYGETIEKLATRRYRITRGGFTTCVQPTPRWEVTSSTVLLNLDEYAIARNTLLRVKGVPLMYLPVVYYPIQDDDRATGFLMPSYGTSTLRGQAISNAFFWAIDRSQDATFFHDWFTRTGQGVGGEYRVVTGPQSSGNLRFYRFGQRQTEYTQDGVVSVLPETTSYELRGTMTQAFGRTVRARGRLDYFSDIVTQQLYHQSVYEASRRSRIVEGSATAALGRLSTSALFQRTEVFNSATNSVVYGSTPRLTANLAAQSLFDSPVYASATTEYAYLPYRYYDEGLVTLDRSLGRVDVTPTLRAALSRLSFLTVNASAAYRSTYYTRSVDPVTGNAVPDPYLRQYVGLRSEVIGPVLTKIWDTPDSGFAVRMKHVIEPTFTFDYTTQISDYKRVPVLSDASDFVVGGAGRVTYGLNNRLFYRGRAEGQARAGQTREFVTIGIQQTYYSNRESSRYDSAYSSTYGRTAVTDLSPIAVSVRVSPTASVDATTRLEYDVAFGEGLQVLTTSGRISSGPSSAQVSYSRRAIGREDPDDYLTASSSLAFLQGRARGSYAMNWDIGRSTVLSQNVMGAYMAQCCGLQVEFQNFNYPQVQGFPIPADRRINFSFVLAGLGTFSNFFGAFGQ